jgi:hypothetical protein
MMNDDIEIPFGHPAEQADEYTPKNKSYTSTYTANSAGEIELPLYMSLTSIIRSMEASPVYPVWLSSGYR